MVVHSCDQPPACDVLVNIDFPTLYMLLPNLFFTTYVNTYMYFHFYLATATVILDNICHCPLLTCSSPYGRCARTTCNQPYNTNIKYYITRHTILIFN